MSCKTILVNLDIDRPIEPVLAAGADLAQRLQATMVGLCAADAEWPVVGDDGGAMAAELWQDERDEIQAKMKQLHAEFDRLVATREHAEWREALDSPTRALSGVSRVADLIVMRAAKGAASRDSQRSAAPSSVVLQAGRPVLVLARDSSRVPLEKAVVAWKDTREARRALADAVPLLALAGEVTVVTVAKAVEPWMRKSLADVADFLGRHAIQARTEIVEGADENEQLAEWIAASHADLVVSGAYGHSRLREWAFGGVTRSLLDKTDVHRFMSC